MIVLRIVDKNGVDRIRVVAGYNRTVVCSRTDVSSRTVASRTVASSRIAVSGRIVVISRIVASSRTIADYSGALLRYTKAAKLGSFFFKNLRIVVGS